MTRIVSTTVLGLLFGVVLIFSSFRIGVHLASADTPPTLIDAGAGSATAAKPPTADQLPDPTSSPAAAYHAERDLWHYSWAAAIFGALVMLLQCVVWARTHLASVPLLGKLAAWLAVNKRVVWVSALSLGAAAAYNAVVGGGTWYAALILLGGKLIAMINFGGAQPQPQPASS